jgi:hypothetical protein
MKDQLTTNHERKPQEGASLQSSGPSSQKEVLNRKGEGQRKDKSGKANTARQGK